MSQGTNIRTSVIQTSVVLHQKHFLIVPLQQKGFSSGYKKFYGSNYSWNKSLTFFLSLAILSFQVPAVVTGLKSST
jgi:hypothetical protein